MIKIYVSKQGQYPVKASKVKKFLRNFFENEGIVSDSYVSVAFVGEKQMLLLAKKYFPKDNKVHNVFSFVEQEVPGFKTPKEAGINLGEIVVCYPEAMKQASLEVKLVDDVVLELIEHAGAHLMGRHHE